jgi:hypothetical protein
MDIIRADEILSRGRTVLSERENPRHHGWIPGALLMLKITTIDRKTTKTINRKNNH